jgi:hypothetical protein
MSLDLIEEIRAGRKIYVKNLSNPRGALFLTLFDMGNRPLSIQIPPTPHPFCLSDVATEFAMNEGGLALRVLLTRGFIKLISQAKAEKILSNPEVRAELAAAVASTLPTNDKTRAYRTQRDPSGSLAQAAGINSLDGSPLVVNASGLHANGIEDRNVRVVNNEDEGDDEAGVSPQVRVIVAQLSSKEINSKEAKFKLSGISDQLTEQDLAYLNAQTSGQVREYVQNLLAQSRGLQDEDDDDDDDDNKVPEPVRRNQNLDVGVEAGDRTLDPAMIPADLMGTQTSVASSAFGPASSKRRQAASPRRHDDEDIEE